MPESNQQPQLIYSQEIETKTKTNPFITFSKLDKITQDNTSSEYSQVDYEENNELLGKFLKKFSISIQGTTGVKSNEIPIYLHNNSDKAPHYEMTESTYESYKDILDTLDLVVFTYSDSEKETVEDKDKRLQHLLKFLDKIREEQGN